MKLLNKILNLVLITVVLIGGNSDNSKGYSAQDQVSRTLDMAWTSNSCMFYAPNAMKKMPVGQNKSSRVYCVIS